MLTLISPAKTLDFESPACTAQYSEPAFLERSEALIAILRDYSPQALAELMKLSDKLASLNVARYASWQRPFTVTNAKQAILAFKGDVYTGLDAETLDEGALRFSQDHLRILSGLYGVLKPLDLIQPYRLEMGTRLETPQGRDLYTYWGDTLTQHLNRELAAQPAPVLINLASNEYFKAVHAKQLNAEIITPVFKDFKNGQYKVISFYAKKARGLMSRFILENRIQDPQALKEFDSEGYRFEASLSKPREWVFTRRLED